MFTASPMAAWTLHTFQIFLSLQNTGDLRLLVPWARGLFFPCFCYICLLGLFPALLAGLGTARTRGRKNILPSGVGGGSGGDGSGVQVGNFADSALGVGKGARVSTFACRRLGFESCHFRVTTRSDSCSIEPEVA